MIEVFVRLFRSVAAAALCSVPVSAFAQQAPAPEGEQPAEAPAAPAAAAQPVEAPAAPEGADQPAGAAADEAALQDGEEEDPADTIVVTGTRLRGAVLGDIPPEIQLTPRDIRSYGASNIGELLQALAPQVGSSRGRGGGGGPVILVNGRRISGFSEISDLPPEALERVDILPEEVALRYGYRADQRVVNFVLRQRFNAVTAEVNAGLATAGGREVYGADINYLTIQGPQRTGAGAQYQRSAALLESERDIIQDPNRPDTGAGDFRTLLPQVDTLTVNGTHSRMIGSVASTIDGRFVNTRTQSLLGLPSNDATSRTALTRRSDTSNAHMGFALDGSLLPWRWNLTGNLDRVETDTVTDRLAGVAPDAAEQINQSATADLLANGPVTDLWAGPLNASLKLSGELRSLDSQSTRAGLFRETSLSRRRLEGQASFDLPITSTREGVLDGLGDLSVNLNLNAEQLSDFGTLTTIGYGFNWRPIPDVTILASVTQEEGAPGITQLGDPVIATPNVRVFDFVRGETVDITRVEGGNPNLVADNRRVFSLGINARPLETLFLRANYTDIRIDNPIAGFPTATAEIEAAFPDRFVRDAGGRLVSIDARPVNFARSERRQFRWNLDLSLPWGPQGQQGPFGGFGGGGRRGVQGGQGGRGGQGGQGDAGQPGAAAQTGGGPGAGGPRGPRGGGGGPRGPGGGGRGGGFGFGGGGGGRILFGLSHTWRLEDRVLIREGVPELDFLNGSAAGNGGGTPRHQVELNAGLFRDGLGARLEANWQSGTRVSGIGGSDLFFSDRTIVNLRLFANLAQRREWVRAVPFLRGSRVSLNINNVFDTRVDVRDVFGETPLSYQPNYLDPLGRSVTISLRKMFF
jgi:hypothetical protein